VKTKLVIISLLHVTIGVCLSLFHGIFYGDAINFYNYREFLDFSFDLEFIELVQNVNVGFVSVIYETPMQCLFVNFLTVLIFNYLISYALRVKAIKGLDSDKNLKIFYILSVLVILCPSVVARFGEPSREYMQNLLLFLAGVLLTISLKRFAVCLLFVVLIRPVMFPIYFLWLGFVYVYRKKREYILLYVFLTIISITLAANNSQVLNFYSERIIDYYGILGENNSVIYRLALNIFGDFNSFYTDNYDYSERLLYLLDYLWRFIFIFYLIKFGRGFSLIFIIYGATLISLVFPFPHPRYFIPLLFFIAGLLATSNFQSFLKRPSFNSASRLSNKL